MATATGATALLDPAPVVLAAVPLRIDPAEVRAFWAYRPPGAVRAAELAAGLEAAREEIARVARRGSATGRSPSRRPDPIA